MGERDTEAAFKWIVSIIQKHNIPFQIGGGFAARVYGVKRELADIDIAMPTDRLKDLLPDVKEHITWDLGPFSDKNWQVAGMTVKYKGQEIDLVGAQGKKFFDQKTKQWVTFENDFSSSEYKEVYGLTVPLMAKDKLIAYKSMIRREVDLQDLEQLAPDNKS